MKHFLVICISLALSAIVLIIFDQPPARAVEVGRAQARTQKSQRRMLQFACPPAINANPVAYTGKIPLPPARKLYHAVYPGGTTGEEDDITPGDVTLYQQTVGKAVTWIYFSHNWYHGRDFPVTTTTWIRALGSVPFIRLMMRSTATEYVTETTFTLDNIIAGMFDSDLRKWFRAARDFGSPLLVEYGTEVNGEWFPWNALYSGEDPARFRDAYRHIIQLSREQGATNITWVFHANNNDVPNEPWNCLEQYYPGDEWIDWIGVSVYGAQQPTDTEWLEFRGLMDGVYGRLTTLGPKKPIVLLEFGATPGNPLGDQTLWAENALKDLTAFRWSRVIGLSWWNEEWTNDDGSHTDMRVQDNPALASVFQRQIGNQNVVLGRLAYGTFLPITLY